LEANGMKPDLIVGCSAGSVIGALYASGLDSRGLDQALEKMDANVFGELAIPGLGFLSSPLGLVQGEGLHAFVDRSARRHVIEEFPIKFAAVATDLGTGLPTLFNSGDVGLAVHASSAVPGLITPAKIAGRIYSDCQISSPLPIRAAKRLGARKVIAVDVVYPPEDAVLTSALRVTFQALTIATYRLKESELGEADLVISPDLPSTSGQFGFSDRTMIIEAGARAAQAALPGIRTLFER
jgi:NTE family protein